jgi:hypothetical protein
VRIAFKPSADIDPPLASRRIAQLRRIVPREAAETELEPPAAANSVFIVPIQTISAQSLQPAQPDKQPTP